MLSAESETIGRYFGQPVDGGAFRESFEFWRMDRVHFGPGSVEKLSGELDALGARRVFVVTTPSLRDKTEHVGRIERLLGDRRVGTFSESVQHVPRATALAAADAARTVGADCVVSLGGGSPVDLAKAVVFCLAKEIREEKDFEGWYVRDEGGAIVRPPIVGQMMPHIAITTTLSAAEFTPGFGATDRIRRAKDAYLSTSLTPRAVILDPELALDTPDWLWAGTGMRAIDHAVESLCSIAPHPLGDALATRGLQIMAKALPRAVSDPTDVIARGACQVAMWMSAYALFNVPQGMSHAIGHQLGARCDLPHGVCSAIMLPVVMDYNLDATAARQALVAEAMGVDVVGMSVKEAAATAADAVRSLVESVGIKPRLRDWGIRAEDLSGVAEAAVDDFMLATNPVAVTGPETVLELLRTAY